MQPSQRNLKCNLARFARFVRGGRPSSRAETPAIFFSPGPAVLTLRGCNCRRNMQPQIHATYRCNLQMQPPNPQMQPPNLSFVIRVCVACCISHCAFVFVYADVYYPYIRVYVLCTKGHNTKQEPNEQANRQITPHTANLASRLSKHTNI